MKIIPNSRPHLTKQKALELVAEFHRSDAVILLGIRGYYEDTMGEPGVNDRGIYDDAIIIIAKDYFQTFNANTDPSVIRKGISVLAPGVHLYRKGNHGISKPGGGYPALRPATPGEKLPVIRDMIGRSEGVAINIHKGSLSSTSSEGCQTVYPLQWLEFISKVYSLMDEYGMTKIPYILVDNKNN